MRQIFKLFIASVLSVALSVATVICCCSASAAMAHFHKAVICSHCQGAANSNGDYSNQAGVCQHQFQSAEFFHGATISSPVVSSAHAFPVLAHYRTIVLPSLSLSYPHGSPPLTVSFTPLYLRTFSLRI